MSEKMIGFIGGGNMASAIIGGLLSSGLSDREHVIASDKSEASVERLKESFGIRACSENTEVSSAADILFLAVKPDVFKLVIPEIRDSLKKEAVVVSIAAGQSIAKVEAAFERPVKLIRVMPNTPALVGASMSALCRNELVTEEELEEVYKLFCSFGEAEVIPEKLMDAVVGISGSSPAYVYMIIEAMADAAVADGMPEGSGLQVCGAGGTGIREDGSGDGKASGRIEGYGLLARRNYH